MIITSRLFENVWAKAEQATARRILDWHAAYYAHPPEPPTDRTGNPDTADPLFAEKKRRYDINIAVYKDSLRFRDMLQRYYFPFPRDAEIKLNLDNALRPTWTTQLKSKLSSTLSKLTRPPTQSGGTK